MTENTFTVQYIIYISFLNYNVIHVNHFYNLPTYNQVILHHILRPCWNSWKVISFHVFFKYTWSTYPSLINWNMTTSSFICGCKVYLFKKRNTCQHVYLRKMNLATYWPCNSITVFCASPSASWQLQGRGDTSAVVRAAKQKPKGSMYGIFA